MPVVAEMKRHLLGQKACCMRETTLQVLKEPGKSAESESYMWLYLTVREAEPVVIYDYQRSRGGEHPRDFLAGFKGDLHVDGYAGYHKVKDVTLVGCWAHARRKYDEALKAAPEARSNPHSVAAQGLNWCNQLFAIERGLADTTPEERLATREEQSRPVLDGLLCVAPTAEIPDDAKEPARQRDRLQPEPVGQAHCFYERRFT